MAKSINPSLNIEIILLAAGKSGRIGFPKQLLLFNNEILINYIINLLEKINVNLNIALGAYFDYIIKELKTKKQTTKVYKIFNWNNGIGATIKNSLEKVLINNPSLEGVIFFVVDQIFLNEIMINSILTSINKYPNNIIFSKYDDGYGIPAYFPKSIFEEIFLLDDQKGCKEIIDKHYSKSHYIHFENGNIDIDTEEDCSKYSLIKNSSKLKI